MTTHISSNVRLHFRAPGTPLTGTVRYAIGACMLGALLVARSDDGLCAIFMDDEPDRLRELLAHAFPANRLEESSSTLQSDLAQVGAFIDEPATDVSLDLNVGGTLFQQQVWKSLCEIPAGLTRSYAEVAQHVGKPDAVRAVAGACAANVLAIAIPCHRVVRGDGSVSGYRWGVERKRSLLRRERVQ